MASSLAWRRAAASAAPCSYAARARAASASACLHASESSRRLGLRVFKPSRRVEGVGHLLDALLACVDVDGGGGRRHARRAAHLRLP